MSATPTSDVGTSSARPGLAPPHDFLDHLLFEIVNLTERDTNVPGTLIISTAIGAHGPRVKWYPATPGRALPCLILSVDLDPVVRDDFLPPHVSRPVLPVVSEWVRLNHKELLRFWCEGETWDRHAVSSFLDALRPVKR